MAFVEAIVNRMRADRCTVLAFAHTQSVHMVLIMLVFVVLYYFLETVQGLGHRLPVVAEAPLQPDGVLGWTQHRLHEFWRRARALRELLVIDAVHRVGVDPEDVSESLNGLSLVIFNEVADEETAALALNVPIMALCGAGCGAAGRANGGGRLADEFGAARTPCVLEVKQRPVASIKLIVDFIS